MSAPKSPDGNARHVTDTVNSGRVSKNPKACEECRRRKQRCNGKQPCALCTKRESNCSYRSYIRQRASRASSTSVNLSKTSDITSILNDPSQNVTTGRDDNDGPPDGLPRSMPPRLAIFNNIRATQATPRGKTELFYGASSPFAVLPHLDAHVPMNGLPAVVYSDRGAEEVQDGDRSIRSYNYQNIVFDHLPSPTPHPVGAVDLSYASAQIALRNCLMTAYPRLPFLDPKALCSDFEKLYGSSSGAALPATEKAIVITALGLGALPLIDLPHRQLFITQARAEVATILYDINLKIVQVTLMMAQFEFQAGSPNICYLHLGSAIRKAFAAGVHRISTHEAKQTMWSLYCNESLVCFTLGKQPGLMEEHISLPGSEDVSYLAYFVRLCSIVRSAYRTYHLDDTVAADLSAAKSVYQQLREFSALINKNTRLEIGGQIYALAGEDLAWHIAISYAYYVTKLLLFRPFLLLCLELKRRGVNDILRERNGGVEMIEVNEAATYSVDAATKIIDFCKSLFSMNVGIEGLYHHAFYLESACFVLGLAAVHNSNRFPSDCLEKVHTGLQLLRQLGTGEPVRSTSAAIEQMLARISALDEGTGSRVEQAARHDQPSIAMTDPQYAIGLSPTSHAASSSIDPMPGSPTSLDLSHELLLDDLWSMMDWNVGFPSMEIPSAITTPGL